MLIPILKLANKTKPRALIVLPEHDKNDILDLRDNYWKNLTKIDGVEAQEFYRRCSDKSLQDSAKDEDEKESVKMKYSHDRFQFTKTFSIAGQLTEDRLNQFIDLVQKNKYGLLFTNSYNFRMKPFFESEEPLKPTFSERVVGEDFKKKIAQSSHDCVLLLEHPLEEENREYVAKYEQYVQNHPTTAVKFYSMKSFNESDVFKAGKLFLFYIIYAVDMDKYHIPSVLYFKGGLKSEPKVLDIKKDLVK